MEDGGSDIDFYELWRNQGTGTQDFIKVDGYDGWSLEHSMAAADESLTGG